MKNEFRKSNSKMNKISSAIKCENCKQILKSPVSLPCGHTICQKHTTDNTKSFAICITCEIEHEIPENGGFPVNLAINRIIESEIDTFDFGKEHNEAKESCAKLDELLMKVEQTLNDPFNLTYDAIECLKNDVQLKGERMKLEIEKKMACCFKKLDDYKLNCKSHLKTSEYLKEAERFVKENDFTRTQLNEWLGILDMMKWNEPEWRRIKNESRKKIETIQNELSRFETDMLLQKRYDEIRAEIEQDFGEFSS